jgi:zinc D-Ala-D-Ala dipeptidase
MLIVKTKQNPLTSMVRKSSTDPYIMYNQVFALSMVQLPCRFLTKYLMTKRSQQFSNKHICCLLAYLVYFLSTPSLISASNKAETMVDPTPQHESQIQSWEELLNKYPQEIILKEQLSSFVAGTSPTIAAPLIKSIPIQECNQSLVDIRVIQVKNPHSRISMMPNPPNNQPFSGTDYNAGLPHSGKIRQGMFERLMRMVDQLDKLAEDFGYKPGHIDIKVFEGLRDLTTQAMIFNNKAAEIAKKNPTWSKEQIEKETEKWVSPVKNNTPVHSTGAAIDIRLWDKTTSSFLDMGPFGVFSPNPTAPSFSKGISNEQQLNRLFLLLAATRAGLVNYSYEFWHFSYGDRYAAYWLEKNPSQRKAIYGSVSNPS